MSVRFWNAALRVCIWIRAVAWRGRDSDAAGELQLEPAACCRSAEEGESVLLLLRCCEKNEGEKDASAKARSCLKEKKEKKMHAPLLADAE